MEFPQVLTSTKYNCYLEQIKIWYRTLYHITVPSRRLDVTDYNWICVKLRPYAYLWKDIGLGLGFLAAELNCIEANHRNDINSSLYAMLDNWLQWAPGDDRGSRDYATVRSLSTAVDKAGLGLLAQELRLGWKKK